MVAADHLFCIGNDRQVAQSQKVHLQKSQFFQSGHGILGDNRLIIFGKRHILFHRVSRNHNARCVGGGVARHPFDF